MKRFDVAATLTLIFLLTSGCSDPGNPPEPGATREAALSVSVGGTFRVGGGPFPGIDEPLSGTVTFEGPVSKTATATNGMFALDLPPGEYRVTGHPEGVFARATCPSRSAVVQVEQAMQIAVNCIVE